MEEKKKFKLYQKWWFWIILLVIILIFFATLVFMNNSKDNNYKKQAITILKQYENGNITRKEASEKLSNLSKKLEKEPEPNNLSKSASRFALRMKLSLLSLELFNGELSDTEVDNNIKEIKNK